MIAFIGSRALKRGHRMGRRGSAVEEVDRDEKMEMERKAIDGV